MTTEFELSGTSREELILTKDQLIVDEPIVRHWPTKKELPPESSIMEELKNVEDRFGSNVADEQSRSSSGHRPLSPSEDLDRA